MEKETPTDIISRDSVCDGLVSGLNCFADLNVMCLDKLKLLR